MGLISSVLIALRVSQISIPIALSRLACSESCYVIQPVLALCQLFFFSVFKGLRTPHWVPCWGTSATLGATKRDRWHAETCRGTCSLQRGWLAHPWIKACQAFPTALWIFFCLPKLHEPVQPWMTATQLMLMAEFVTEWYEDSPGPQRGAWTGGQASGGLASHP